MKSEDKTLNNENRTKKLALLPLGIAALVIVVILAVSSVTQVPTGHTGVLTTFGRVADYTLDSGIHVKAPWQKVIKMDNRIQRATENLSCFSSDIQEVTMVYTLNYQISSKDAMTIYRTIGSDYYSKIIVPTVQEAVKVCTAKYTAEELVSERTALAMAIEQSLSDKLTGYNIMVNSTAIENMDFTDAFTNAVEAKQVAQQNKLKAETEAQQKVIEAKAAADVKQIEADAEAYRLVKKAEAEAEAYRLISESLTDKVLSKMYYDNWDGKLPSVITDGSTLLNIPALSGDSAE
ncbi:MAG: prohibitin family protein [Lachnospiraceae bacterium]|nr:prohibitin family protein [Lachnospiraceae bacterium]